jgi:hypothetical protein
MERALPAQSRMTQRSAGFRSRRRAFATTPGVLGTGIRIRIGIGIGIGIGSAK